MVQRDGEQLTAAVGDRPALGRNWRLERAIMAIRFSEYMIGTQFHPEKSQRLGLFA